MGRDEWGRYIGANQSRDALRHGALLGADLGARAYHLRLTYPAVISATSESVSWRRGHADPDYNIGKECDLRSVLLGLTMSYGACCGVGRHLG